MSDAAELAERIASDSARRAGWPANDYDCDDPVSWGLSFRVPAERAVTIMLEAGWRPPAEQTGAVIPSRRTDPDTSRNAEPTPVRAGTQRARLLAAFALEAAADGLTDEEAADLAAGVPYRSEFAKRCSELRQAGLIAVVPHVTRAGVAGHQRIVSAITPAGRALAETLNTP